MTERQTHLHAAGVRAGGTVALCLSRMELRVTAGQALVRIETSPYGGTIDPSRWVDGWLRTPDAGASHAATGPLTISG